MKLALIFEHADLAKLQSGVVVEMWDRIMNTGRGKRKFKEAFSKAEQEAVRALYKTFYHWYRISGLPREHRMTMWTYNLMIKTCNFFGTY